MRNTLCSLLIAALCATSSAALAQTTNASTVLDRSIEDEHRRGMALRAQHRDEAARAVFEALWTRTHEPRARARQALAEQSLGRYAEAESHLAEALAHGQDPWIAQNRALLEPVLQQARAAQGVAILTVRCEPAHAGVVIGGTEVGSAGSTLRIAPGTVSFEVRAEGFASVTRTVELTPGSVARVDVALVRSEVAQGASALAASQSQRRDGDIEPRAPSALRAGARPTAVTSGPSTSRGGGMASDLRPAPSPLRPLAWVSAGLAVASSGVALVGFAVGSSAAAQWNSDACLRATLTREQSCPNEITTAESMRAVSVAGFVAAGVFAAGAATLFVVGRPGLERRERAGLRCAPSIRSLVCTGEF
ncbi:MAG: PEGA domain-containing protein [Polyangiales bacterium]